MRLRTRPQSHLTSVAAAADVAEPLSLTAAPTVAPPTAVAAAADAEDAPSKRNAKNARAKTAMAPSPPLLIVLMSLLRLFHRLILMSHLLLHWLKE